MGREMIVADFAASAASIVTLGHGVSKSSSERVEQRLSTLSTPENMTDPGTQRAPLIAAQVSSLKDLLYNPEEGHSSEPNWAQLGTVDGHNMGIYLKNALQVSRGFLDPSKPTSMSLLKVVDSCTPVCRLSSVFKTCGPHSSLTDRSQVLDDLIVTTRSAQIDDLLSRIPIIARLSIKPTQRYNISVKLPHLLRKCLERLLLDWQTHRHLSSLERLPRSRSNQHNIELN